MRHGGERGKVAVTGTIAVTASPPTDALGVPAGGDVAACWVGQGVAGYFL